MATIEISASDVSAAGNFLEQFLTDEVPSGDFTRGTALRDLTIGALAAIFAYLTNENNLVKNRQSLKTIQAGVVDTEPESLADAVTALLSNFFISPKSGLYARGTILCHASAATDIFIQPTQRFTKTPGVVFKVDSDTTYFIAAGYLLPIVDVAGNAIEYLFYVPLIALATGESFNIDPGTFSDFNRFNPYVTRVENLDKFSGGRGPETTQELLARAPTAISVRNLINSRSIQAVLDEQFPSIKSMVVVGMGDPEMQRDVLTGVGNHLALHIGGATDIYLMLPMTEATFTGIIGGSFLRPDGIVNIFRDAATPFAATVKVGDILKVTAGLPGVPREFFITDVTDTQLLVSDRIPFPAATDEASPVTYCTYSIGHVPTDYADVIPVKTTGTTSRRTASTSVVTLPGGPVMDFLDVALVNPPVGMNAYKDPVDGFIHLTDRVNSAPANGTDPTVALQFRTVVQNPLSAQSACQWLDVVVPALIAGVSTAGLQLRVRYLTLSNYTSVYTYVLDRGNRTNCASQLPRGHHPVTLSASISYRLKPTATDVLNNDDLAQAVAAFINDFDTSISPIDVSSISTFLKDTYQSIAAVFPFTIAYTLAAPTGQVIDYSTTDEVVLTTAKKVVGEPDIDFLAYGISNRTVRYLTTSGAITLTDLGA